ncbi:hypothetical protein SOVF_175900 isoform A [Spinacia oleracea]|uniref:Uncharacterized protein isoform X2 n=1 Tax=Spinacia oleracea TaxID=3562 RepID=A0A9R0JB66_SPIOL|nr:uncharacterized protein LOC110803447 isoform X2 [Spinacia oleracea]KNA07002.1 hypothetical protein SOVF_175900 isoform A [Spinacia oleracea]
MLHRSFKPAKCKTALNLAKSRIKLMKNKKDNQLKHLKREVAQLLESGQDQTARIRVEHVIREEKLLAAYEMIEIYCELIVVRLPIIESQKNCPLDLKEAIASLIFAAPRCGDITELQDVRKHFTAKYGKEFATAAAEVRPACGVSRSLVEKLSVIAPDGQTKVKFLTAIAEENNIKWEPNWFKEENPPPFVDIPVAAVQSVESSKIQMQPLNFEIADVNEENHSHDKARPETSSQSHARTNSGVVPPSSTYRPDSRPSESPSQKINGQSSGTFETAFVPGRQKWNMEFKDATAAAQAAAESAEMASMAARAAIELSRSNVVSEDNHHYTNSGLQHNQVHRNSVSGSFNQRSPRMEKHEDSSRQGNMNEGGDARSLNKDYTQYGEEYESGKQDFGERENSRRHNTRGSDSSPIITSKAEPGMFSSSSNFQEYKVESSENPFYEEETVGKEENQSRNSESKSTVLGDDYGVFPNLNYDSYQYDSGDDSLNSFSRKTADQEDWNVKSAYTFGEEDTTFKDNREGNRIPESDDKYGFDSVSDIFVGVDHRTSGVDIDEKGTRTNAEVFFDESGSDEDDKSVLNPTEEHNYSVPSESTCICSSLNQDKPRFEPDLSESFKRSPIYSKLTEPMPLTFDDSDKESSGSEKEAQRENFDSEALSYDYQKPDADPHRDLRTTFVEKGTADSFMNSKQVEENQNRYSGSVSKNNYSFDKSSESSTDIKSRSDYDLFDGGSKKSFQSPRLSESRNPVSEVELHHPTPEVGIELNLGSLPGGRRNRAQGRLARGKLADASSSPNNTFGSSEKASSYEFPSQIDNKEVPVSMKLTGLHRSYESPIDDTQVVILKKDDENVGKISSKSSTRYFDSDDSDSSSEEDDVLKPKPAASKTFLGAGLSRRTNASTPRSVATSSSVAAAKAGRSSSSNNNEVSSSRIIDQSGFNDRQNLAKSSEHLEEKPVTPKHPDVPEKSSSLNEKKAPSRENSGKNPSHVHPKLPDFETFTAHLQSLRTNRH